MDVWITTDWLQRRTGKHRSTIARWRARGCIPTELERLARLELGGELELIHAQWAGWRLDPRSGTLVTPGGEPHAAGEIQCLGLLRQRVDALEAELAQLRALRARSRLARLGRALIAWFAARHERARKRRRPSPLDPDYALGFDLTTSDRRAAAQSDALRQRSR